MKHQLEMTIEAVCINWNGQLLAGNRYYWCRGIFRNGAKTQWYPSKMADVLKDCIMSNKTNT